MSGQHTSAAPATLLWFWDYDTQWGADRSRNPHRVPAWGPLEFENTERVLALHAEFAVPACFAVVGAAALPGARPYHDPGQVRRIHQAGHEVASHSHRHEWLPGLTGVRLRETLVSSRDALEQCIGAPVTTFVPPYNQPFDHPGKLSVSLSERREAWGNRTDLPTLCAALADAGYALCRVTYQSIGERIAERLAQRPLERAGRVERIGGLPCVRLNTRGGFGADTRALLARGVADGGIWVVYGHPHSTSDVASSQSLDEMRRLLEQVARWRAAGRLRCALPRDLGPATGTARADTSHSRPMATGAVDTGAVDTGAGRDARAAGALGARAPAAR